MLNTTRRNDASGHPSKHAGSQLAPLSEPTTSGPDNATTLGAPYD